MNTAGAADVPKSARDDGRGHWPRGKWRKPPTTESKAAAALLKHEAERRGRNATARLLGVDPRTLGRWLRGERHMDATDVARVKAVSHSK